VVCGSTFEVSTGDDVENTGAIARSHTAGGADIVPNRPSHSVFAKLLQASAQTPELPAISALECAKRLTGELDVYEDFIV